MGFFDYFFDSKNKVDQPKIQFGRFSDAYKNENKYDAWDQALSLFEAEEYLEAYRKFFHYLTDESADNCKVIDHKDHITFEFFQGSKTIKGRADRKTFVAEAKIARTTDLHIGFLRRLLEDNYQLKYCRYALDDENSITAVFSSSTIDGSPYKLYYALKELATHADKKDDILISEFDMLSPINNKHIREIEEKEILHKYSYLTSEIGKVFDQLERIKLKISQYPGAESYSYLDLIYRIDYLVKPEGDIMDTIDTAHNLYFHNKLKTSEQKNRLIKKMLEKIRATPMEQFTREIYEVKSTFGVTQASGLTRIQEFISSEIKNMDWYYENGHDHVALSIPSYIIGYSLFSYSMPVPMRDLFNLFYQITQYDFFLGLGIDGGYNRGGKLNSSKIKKEIKSIISKHIDEYPELEVNTKELSLENECTMAKTYLLMVQKMDFTRKDHR